MITPYPLTGFPLAPSELVLLNGEIFAPPAGLAAKITLLHTDMAVSAADLVQVMLAVAFLANEQAGALRLEVRAKPTAFGPSKLQTLYADPGNAASAWPEYSLETRLQPLAVRLRDSGNAHEAAAVVHGLLEVDAPNPWHHAGELVKRWLSRRGLLEAVEVVQFGLVKTQAYRLPDTTKALAAQAPVDAVQQLVDECSQSRPHVWEHLGRQIEAGLRQRLKVAGDTGVRRRAELDDE